MYSHLSGYAVALLILEGCTTYAAPPRDPPHVAPTISDMPSSPPAEGMGRLTVDVDGGPAKVARVISEEVGDPHMSTQGGGAQAFTHRKTELLCITPCAMDLRIGAHTLVFTSTSDGFRTGSGDVIVSSQPSIVRHALGREKPASGKYMSGVLLTALGAGITTIGVFATSIGGAAELSAQNSTKGEPKTFLTAGLVVLGVGIAMGTTGIVLMSGNQAVHQPGSTTQWVPVSR